MAVWITDSIRSEYLTGLTANITIPAAEVGDIIFISVGSLSAVTGVSTGWDYTATSNTEGGVSPDTIHLTTITKIAEAGDSGAVVTITQTDAVGLEWSVAIINSDTDVTPTLYYSTQTQKNTDSTVSDPTTGPTLYTVSDGSLVFNGMELRVHASSTKLGEGRIDRPGGQQDVGRDWSYDYDFFPTPPQTHHLLMTYGLTEQGLPVLEKPFLDVYYTDGNYASVDLVYLFSDSSNRKHQPKMQIQIVGFDAGQRNSYHAHDGGVSGEMFSDGSGGWSNIDEAACRDLVGGWYSSFSDVAKAFLGCYTAGAFAGNVEAVTSGSHPSGDTTVTLMWTSEEITRQHALYNDSLYQRFQQYWQYEAADGQNEYDTLKQYWPSLVGFSSTPPSEYYRIGGSFHYWINNGPSGSFPEENDKRFGGITFTEDAPSESGTTSFHRTTYSSVQSNHITASYGPQFVLRILDGEPIQLVSLPNYPPNPPSYATKLRGRDVTAVVNENAQTISSLLFNLIDVDNSDNEFYPLILDVNGQKLNNLLDSAAQPTFIKVKS